jgi:hypothetical protein
LSESRLTGLAGHQAPPLVSECNLKRKERTKLDSTKPDRQTEKERQKDKRRKDKQTERQRDRGTERQEDGIRKRI